jgi:hypothetical protein
MPPRAFTLLAALLLLCTSARAEAALADLIFLLPQMILAGIYYELARPWVLGSIWAIAALCWMAFFITGRDAVGDLMDRFGSSGNGWFNPTTHGAMGFLAVASLLYVLLGYMVWGAPPPERGMPGHGQPAARAQASAKPLPPKPLPYPYGKSAANPQGQWPTTTGPLPDASLRAYGGGGYVMLRNPGDDALWARLCPADEERCTPVRQIYLAPRSAYLLERITDGRYRVVYTQVTGSNLSGSSPVFRPDQQSRQSETLVLNSFEARP